MRIPNNFHSILTDHSVIIVTITNHHHHVDLIIIHGINNHIPHNTVDDESQVQVREHHHHHHAHHHRRRHRLRLHRHQIQVKHRNLILVHRHRPRRDQVIHRHIVDDGNHRTIRELKIPDNKKTKKSNGQVSTIV